MDTRYKYCLIGVAFFVILSLVNCRSSCIGEMVNNAYSFKLGVKITPDKDTISVGDTIWLNVNTSNSFKNLISGDTVKFSGAQNLGTSISFDKLDSVNLFSINAANKFTYLLFKGLETRNADESLFREFLFVEVNNKYVFQLGIIAKEKGTFRIGLSNASNVYRASDKCSKAGFTINIVDSDRNYYLYPSYKGGPIPEGGDYYFVVR